MFLQPPSPRPESSSQGSNLNRVNWINKKASKYELICLTYSINCFRAFLCLLRLYELDKLTLLFAQSKSDLKWLSYAEKRIITSSWLVGYLGLVVNIFHTKFELSR